MSLIDIKQIEGNVVAKDMRCTICNGQMHEIPNSLKTIILGIFLPEYKYTKTYRCEECYKVTQTRES